MLLSWNFWVVPVLPLFFFWETFQLSSCTFLMIGFGAIFLNLKSWVNEESRATSVFNLTEKKLFQKTARHGFVSWCWWCLFLFKVHLTYLPHFSRVSDVQLRCKMACCTLRKVVPLPLPPLALWPRIPMNPTIPKPSRNPLHVIWSIPWLAHVSILPCRTGLYTAFGLEVRGVCRIGRYRMVGRWPRKRVQDAYRAAGLVLRDRLLAPWKTKQRYRMNKHFPSLVFSWILLTKVPQFQILCLLEILCEFFWRLCTFLVDFKVMTNVSLYPAHWRNPTCIISVGKYGNKSIEYIWKWWKLSPYFAMLVYNNLPCKQIGSCGKNSHGDLDFRDFNP